MKNLPQSLAVVNRKVILRVSHAPDSMNLSNMAHYEVSINVKTTSITSLFGFMLAFLRFPSGATAIELADSTA